MLSGSKEGSYLRLIIGVSLNSRIESNKEEEKKKRTLRVKDAWSAQCKMQGRVRGCRIQGTLSA